MSTDQSEGAASLIKKELDERLTEEQRRKKQVGHVCVGYDPKQCIGKFVGTFRLLLLMIITT